MVALFGSTAKLDVSTRWFTKLVGAKNGDRMTGDVTAPAADANDRQTTTQAAQIPVTRAVAPQTARIDADAAERSNFSPDS
jgi:hypothetical protein